MTSRARKNTFRAALLSGAALAIVTGSVLPSIGATQTEAVNIHAATRIHDGESYADIVSATRPSVVTVTTRMAQAQVSSADMPRGAAPFDEFFRHFFEQNGPMQMQPGPEQGRMPQAQAPRALGSGFIVDPNGLIVTNNHVVENAESIRVTLDDGRELDATLVGRDPKTDIAVLRVDAGNPLPALGWGDSEGVLAGDKILAIGNPFGIGTTVTAGIVSALGRDLHNGPYDDFLQIDAALNHGNSGGPLLDTSGYVIGINAAIFSPNDGSVGVGFAIPSGLAQKIVAELVEQGHIERGYLGVQIQNVTSDIAAALGIDDAQGALLAAVEPDTPAAKAGLQAGDVIQRVNGEAVDGPKALSSVIADLPTDQPQTLGVWRNGKSMDIDVTLAAMPEDTATAIPHADRLDASVRGLGVTVNDLTPDLRARYGVDDSQSGVVVTGTADGFEGQLLQGDIITAVGTTPVSSVAELRTEVEKVHDSGHGAVLLRVARDGADTFMAVRFAQS